MNLDKFFKLRDQVEQHNFEKSFGPLNKTLYYFSFLGNIFLVLFSYFFVKDVTNSIPTLFSGQDLFFSVFIVLFMTGYELFKRFTLEQLTTSIVRLKTITFNVAIGVIVSLLLIAGSFYLSLKGSHRLVDTTDIVQTSTDSTITKEVNSISKYYNDEIAFYRSQTAKTSADRRYRDSIVSALEQNKERKIAETKQKIEGNLSNKQSEIKENSFAFAAIVFFLEFIIVIGVGFSSYYKWTSYASMKKLMMTPKYKQLELNLNLLKLYYQNGRKNEQDQVISRSKLIALARSAKLQFTNSDINSFIATCSELDIVTGTRNKKVYNVEFEKAKSLIEASVN